MTCRSGDHPSGGSDEAVYRVQMKSGGMYGISIDMCEPCASRLILRFSHDPSKRVDLTLLENL